MRFTNHTIASTLLLTLVAGSDETRNHVTVLNTQHEQVKFMDEPNPPTWPDSVLVFDPSQSAEEIRHAIRPTQDPQHDDGCYKSDHHFSEERWALLFQPGVYENLTFEVGYYVQVLGLGTTPDDVVFHQSQPQDTDKCSAADDDADGPTGPFVPALNAHMSHSKDGSIMGTSLDSFWRSAENFRVEGSSMLWAVSQAAPLRRVHITGNLNLSQGRCYASGGFLAHSVIEGTVNFGTQQQWLSRNVEFRGGEPKGGAWSLVHVGCTGHVPKSSSPGSDKEASITVAAETRVQLEKPYIAMKQQSNQYELRVPELVRNGRGAQPAPEDVRDFSRVRVVDATTQDVTSRIQQALDQGKDVVLAPGIFYLTQSLVIRQSQQVILGLGLATLVAPANGSPCIHVPPRLFGVRIAGIMLEASERSKPSPQDPKESPSSLLKWGEPGITDPGNSDNPGLLSDVFIRVGGFTKGDRRNIYVDTMIELHSGNVVGDNLWLWRADHAELQEGEVANYPNISTLYHQSEQDEFRVETGLNVKGNDVTMYGLAVEHTNGHQTIWSGERGEVLFYQCELPYGVTQASFGDKGYLGYLVHDKVDVHRLHGAGVYSNFRNEPVKVETAIRHPKKENIHCHNCFTVFLDNHGLINSIVNGNGPAADVRGIPTRLQEPGGSVTQLPKKVA